MYLDTDPHSIDVRNEYLNHIVRMFELSGLPKNTAQASALYALDIETRTHSHSIPELESRPLACLLAC